MEKSEYLTLLEEAQSKANPTDVTSKIDEVISAHLDLFKISDPDMYTELMSEIMIIVNGPHFDRVAAEKAVSMMSNEDGTTGEKWSVEDAITVADQFGVVFSDFNTFDWYYVLNMMYSDYFGVFGTKVDTYVLLANAYLNDKDVAEGKAYLYYKDVVCALSTN